jgi:hypothetical protein
MALHGGVGSPCVDTGFVTAEPEKVAPHFGAIPVIVYTHLQSAVRRQVI